MADVKRTLLLKIAAEHSAVTKACAAEATMLGQLNALCGPSALRAKFSASLESGLETTRCNVAIQWQGI